MDAQEVSSCVFTLSSYVSITGVPSIRPVKVELTDFKTKDLKHVTSSECVSTAGVPGVEPVKVELTDFKTKELVDTLEVDAVLVATGRAPFTQVRTTDT